MTDRSTHLRPALALRLRGVRSRLVATYLLAAVVLAAAGVVLFTVALDRGLRAAVDSGLQTRAITVTDDLGRVGSGASSTAAPSAGRRADPTSITAVYAPNGRLVEAEPSPLPAPPLTTTEVHRGVPTATIRSVEYAGDEFRFLFRPVGRPDGRWLVVVGEGLDPTIEAETEVRQALLISVPVLLALVGLGAWLLSGAALRPVDRMRADAQALGEHDSAGRITEPRTQDSLNQLARTFNALLDRLHLSLDRQRALVADAGHELRTPLAVLQLELETAVRPHRTRDDLVESITSARGEVSRLAALAEDLLLLAEADGGRPIVQPELTDVTELLDDVGRAYAGRAGTTGVELVLDRPAGLIAEVDPVAVRRVLDNLLTNALRHTPTGGTVRVTGADGLRLRVADTGPGFPAAFLPHAFDRFGRADQGRSRSAPNAGSGLGLAIVATLAAAHGGAATAANQLTGGAVIEVRLPPPASRDLPVE